MKKTKLKIFSSTLLITLVFFLFGNIIKSNDKNQKLNRFLLNKNDTEEICSKVSDKLKDKYKEMNYEKKEDLTFSENDKQLINFFKDYSVSTFASYIKYLLLRYSLFIVADFILIVFWIFYCFCCCNPFCCCRRGKGCCRKFSFMICILLFIGLIAAGVIGLFFGYPLKRNVIETSCSSFKLFEHFKYGFGDDYENSKGWAGLNNIYNILMDSREIIFEIQNDDELIKTYDENCKINNNDVCTIFKKGVDIIRNTQDYYDVLLESINYSKDSILEYEEGLNDLENKYLNDAYSFLNDYILKYCQLYILLFILVIAFGILGLLFLSAYVHKCQCIKCFYIILWNIEEIFIIIIVLIGVALGLLSVLSQNIIAVIQYSTTPENLNNSNPIVFNENISDIVNECFNEKGNLSEIIQKNSSSLQTFDKLLELKESVENTIKQLKDNDNLKKGFLTLQSIINNTDKIYNNYINNSVYDIIDCKFMKNDINILIDVVNEDLKETSRKLELIIYAASLCIAISIMCGIIVINRYNNDKKKKKGNDLNDTQPFEKDRNGNNSERNKIKEK